MRRLNRRHRLAALLLAACLLASGRASAVDAAPKGVILAAVHDASVAGLRIGMNVDESTRTLTAAGYRISPPILGPNGAEAVLAIVNQLSGKPASLARSSVAVMMAHTDDNRSVEVGFAPTPDGATIISVHLSVPSFGELPAATFATLVKRYGRPQVDYTNQWVWSETTDNTPTATGDARQVTAFNSGAQINLAIDEGGRAAAARKVLLERTARRYLQSQPNAY